MTCLTLSTPAMDRRHALMILNNLCIPVENKAVILFGEPCDPLLNSLLLLIRNQTADAYLAIVILLNLSYLSDDHAKTTLFQFICTLDSGSSEAASTYAYRLPSDDPNSLIRILEALLQDFAPYANTKVNSAEQQCCRWSMNVIRNLVALPTIAATVGTKSSVPQIAAHLLARADTDNLQTWTRDSLEDACLMLLITVCSLDSAVVLLQANQSTLNNILTVCAKLKTTQGIHQTRAIALSNRLKSEENRP